MERLNLTPHSSTGEHLGMSASGSFWERQRISLWILESFMA
jgi:hypothetical protein